MSSKQVGAGQGSLNEDRRRHVRGFSMLELTITVLIVLIGSMIALPAINSVIGTYRLGSAVSSVTGVIHVARYQAISSGYAYQVVFSKTAATFQVQSNPTWPTGTFSNYCVPAAASCPVPLSGSSIPVVLGADTTLQFRPNGMVTAVVGSTPLTLTYLTKTESIAVSTYGNIKVTP
jgi:prepilin-type N-terminal cleavage/methylation domain-containing protein